jgi:FlaA1/EpsC-like NDP-sugar epimerase
MYPRIGDVRDSDRMANIFEEFRRRWSSTRAHKHVPLMEANIEDAVTNNGSHTQYRRGALSSLSNAWC